MKSFSEDISITFYMFLNWYFWKRNKIEQIFLRPIKILSRSWNKNFFLRRKFNWKFIFKTFEIREHEISRQLINRLFSKLRVLNTHPLYWHNNNSTVAKVNSINRIIERERDTSHWSKHSFSPFFSQSTILFMNRSCLKSFERPKSFRIHHAINTTSNQCLDVADPWNTTIYSSRRNNFYRNQGTFWIFTDGSVRFICPPEYSMIRSFIRSRSLVSTLVSTLFQSNLSNRSCAP